MKNTSIRIVSIASATVIIAFYAQASILVQDSFDASGYSIGANLKNLKPGESTGFGAGATWGTSSSTGVFFVNDGLTFPDDFIAKSSGLAIGVGKFAGDATGSREISRQITSDIIKNAGTYYIRFACAITESAESYLSFKGFELLGLLPEQHANSSAISYPASNGLQFGFYKMGSGDGTTALVALKEGGSNANVGALKLVDPVVPGKTYIVVAKIVLDGEGGAAVYAMAGATDDQTFRSAKLPSEPLAVTVSTSPLCHLVYSGTFMTGYRNGTLQDRWASFDEFAIGESLEDVFGFIDSSAPVVYSSEATNVGETGFTANGNLAQCGSSNPELFIDISDDVGETWAETSMGPYSTIGDISYTATGLLSGSTYSWRFRAVNSSAASTSEVQVVTLAGAPVLGIPSVAVADTSATLSVSLETPGLSGAASTTVSLWFAEEGSPLVQRKEFDAVTAADTFEETIDNLTYGKTYIYAFKASVPYNAGTLDTWTYTNKVEVTGAISWTNSGNDGDWHAAGNWSPSVYPSALLAATFSDVGGEVSASSDGAISNLYVNTGSGKPVSIDFGANSLSATYLGVGETTGQSSLTLKSGSFDFITTRIGLSGDGRSSLTVGSNAKLTGGDIYLGHDDRNALSNRLTFASGSETDITGTLFIRSGHYNHAEVENGASVNVGGILLRSSGVTMTVDGGAVTNSGTTVVLSEHNAGTIEDPVVLEFRNGATARLNGKVAVNAARNNASNHAYVHGELRVLDGSSVECRDSIYIDNNNQTPPGGPNDDGASNAAKILVSNATLTATTISICNDGRHHGDELLIFEDGGHTAKVTTSGNVRVAAVGPNNSNVVNYDNRISIEGGELAVGATLYIGDNGPYYANHTNNHVSIGLANSKVTAKDLSVYGVGYVKFRIPENGFDEVPMQISGTADFGAIPQRDSVNIYRPDEWTPVSQVRIDATDFIGTQTLLSASSITGFTEDRIMVDAPPGRKVTVTLTETSLSIRSIPRGTTIIVR